MKRGCTATAACAVLAVALGSGPNFVPWVLAQLLKSLCPLAACERVYAPLQEWAWAQWETDTAGRVLEPSELVEVPIGVMPPAGLRRPFVVRGLLNGSKLGGDISWMSRDPVGGISVDYFSNASVDVGIVPDARAPLADVVNRIMAGGPEKLGTEMIFRSFPALLETMLGEKASPVAHLLGGASHIRPSRIGATLTVPVFVANGAPRARTDLHCEPIGAFAASCARCTSVCLDVALALI